MPEYEDDQFDLLFSALKNLITICAWCRKVRDARGRWDVETAAGERRETSYTHSICPPCEKKVRMTSSLK